MITAAHAGHQAMFRDDVDENPGNPPLQGKNQDFKISSNPLQGKNQDWLAWKAQANSRQSSIGSGGHNTKYR